MKQELVVAEWHWKYYESMNEYWHSEAVRFRSHADKLSQAASEERSKELKRKLVESALTHGVALTV